jgi:mobilome CxxCx(11)CxxC protein
MAFGETGTKYFLSTAAALGVVQAVGFGLSLSCRWEDDFAYALESQTANRVLFDRYKQLGSRPPHEPEQAKVLLDLIRAEDECRTAMDEKKQLTGDELRYGMRAALRQQGKQCAGCGNIPISMQPTNCDVCGNFKLRIF